MRNPPTISLERLVSIRREAFAARRELFDDKDFFKMTEAWEAVCDEGADWKIRTYKSRANEDYKRKAGVIQFLGKVTLTVDEALWGKAEQGQEFANFLLGHEFGHLICDHHSRSATIKHFQLFDGPSGKSNMPPNTEELEANLAAVFFQCGPEIESDRLSDRELAKRAYSDERTIQRIRKYVKLSAYQREISRPGNRYERVVL